MESRTIIAERIPLRLCQKFSILPSLFGKKVGDFLKRNLKSLIIATIQISKNFQTEGSV